LAVSNLAIMYRDGNGTDTNIARYIELLKLGSERGHGSSIASLGVEYAIGDYLPFNAELGRKLQETSLYLEPDSIIARNVARYYRDGSGVAVDDAKATYWFIFAAKLGDGKALVDLHEMIASGRAKFKAGYGPPDGYDPVALLRPAAEAGERNVQYRLGQLMEEAAKTEAGRMEDAIAWYRKASANGHSGAKDALKRIGAADSE
jgi:TPR repeat protein